MRYIIRTIGYSSLFSIHSILIMWYTESKLAEIHFFQGVLYNMSSIYPFYPFTKELDITQLVSLFYYRSSSDFRFDGESHDFWEFIYIDSGKMLITAGEEQYILKSGELAFHKPGEFHAVSAYEQIPANFIVASFVCDSPGMKYFEHRILSLNSKERGYLYDAVRCWQQSVVSRQTPYNLSLAPMPLKDVPFGQAQMVQLYLELLLINLVQQNVGVKISRRVETYAMQVMYKQLTDNVIKYLEDHICESVSLEQIANDLGYSVPQMKKLFRMQMNCGIIDYFIELKMDEAKRLMQKSDMNITQIAHYLGYQDASYFSRLFKSRYGVTPSEYYLSFGEE
jgi:AraC-like DNA-binding protein